MDPEFLELARQAVAALQVGPPPNWAEIAAVIVSAVVGLLQCAVVAAYLWKMTKHGWERDRILDEQDARFRELGRRLAESTRQLGQALEQHRQACPQPSP